MAETRYEVCASGTGVGGLWVGTVERRHLGRGKERKVSEHDSLISGTGKTLGEKQKRDSLRFLLHFVIVGVGPTPLPL